MLALVVFLNGMAIMVLEMVGARLLAPWLGTSIIVWTSLIGVILASLSVGYWLGGMLADHHLRPSGNKNAKANEKNTPPAANRSGSGQTMQKAHGVLSSILFFASMAVFITAMVQGVVLELLSTAIPSLHLAAVCAALLLFSIPSLLCGMVSPYAIRLAITRSETSGAVIGRLNAISTVGSIVGTFLGGFVLISFFGSVETTIGVAAVLLFTAALVRVKPVMAKTALAACILLAVFGVKSYSDYLAARDIHTIESPYSSMRVVNGTMDGRAMRLLLTDPESAQSGEFIDDPDELAFEYTKFYALGTSMNPGSQHILMLGGGGYSVPKWLLSGRSELASKDFQLDVVELDPTMTKTAGSYFSAPLEDPRMQVFHEDARSFINRQASVIPAGQSGKYNLIFADIFNSWYTVPFHVGTREAAANIRRLMSDDGIFIMNIITAVNGDNGRLLRSIRNAFSEVFGEVHVFPAQTRYDGEMVQNVMLLAFRTPRPLPDPATDPIPPHIRRMLANRWTSPFPAPEQDVPALSDNFAPVERYTLGFKH